MRAQHSHFTGIFDLLYSPDVVPDNMSASLVRTLIQLEPRACFVKDKHGRLPAHITCRRRCSVQTLRLLIQVNPRVIQEPTQAGETRLSLAKTKSHVAFIQDLCERTPAVTSSDAVGQVHEL